MIKHHTVPDFGPSDLLSNAVIGGRRVKSASEDSRYSAAYNGKLFVIVAEYTIESGNSIALNLSFASDVFIHSVCVPGGYEFSVRDEFGTGSADGLFPAVNLNVCSVDETPAHGQVYYAATGNGNELDYGSGVIQPFIYACEDSAVSVVVRNFGVVAESIKIVVKFEEIGPRNPLFGLTATTQIEPDTEMSLYG